MKKLFFIFIIFFVNQVFGESRNEIRDRQDRSDFNYNVHAPDYMRAAEKNIADIYANSDQLGFYDFDLNTQRSNSVAQTIVSSFSKPRRHDNVLVMRLFCTFSNSIVNLNARSVNAEWSLEKDQVKGSAQTDREGFLRIRFSSEGSVKGKLMSIKVKNNATNVELGTGPYEMSLSEENCKAK